MGKKYTSEQFWKLYEKLPQELQDALSAEETGNNIWETCKRNGTEYNLEEIVDYVGQVLVGVLPPEDFQQVLEKELKLNKKTAKKVAQEINRYIFYPVKPALEQLYKIETTPAERLAGKPAEKPTEKPEGRPEIKEGKPTAPSKEDAYREPIE